MIAVRTVRRAALAAVLLATAPAIASAAEVQVTASAALQPAFDPATADYVARCAGAPVELAIDAPAATSVAVDGDGPRTGSFTRSVALADNQAFAFTLTGDTNGTYHVRCLPADFPPYSAQRTGAPQARFYALTPVHAFAAPPAGVSQQFVALWDNGGAPVWWYRSPQTPFDAKLLPNGDIAWIRASAPRGIEERRLDGSFVRAFNAVGADADIHELQLLPDGDYLLPVYRRLAHVDLTAIGLPADATIVDAVVQEVTPAGALVWEWRASDHISPSEVPSRWWNVVAGSAAGAYDIYHLNSIEPDGDGLVLSFRHLDAVYRIAASGAGDVKWKFGGVTVAGTSLDIAGDPLLAPPSPDPAGPLGGQHDARILPDGDLTISDNGTHFTGPQWTGRQPRAVRYAIDEAAGTATFVEQLTDPDVTQSLCCGSARKLPGGDWVDGWGGNQKVSEATAGGTRVFNLDFAAPIFSYRANPILPRQLGRRTVRAGMDAQFPRSSLTIGGAPSQFGVVVAGSRAAATRTFTVANSGTLPVDVSAVSVDGADAPEFALTADTCTGVSLGAGTRCRVAIRFQPAGSGPKSAVLRVASDAASGPNVAVLTGTGIVARAPAHPRPRLHRHR